MRSSGYCALFAVVCYASSVAADGIRTAGDILHIALPVYAGVYSLSKGDSEGAKQIASSAAVSTAILYTLKYSINEIRPDGGPLSFPSGHTHISFAASTYLWKRYGPEYGIPATLLATFVGYSRVHAKRHYVHDCVAGAVLGITTSYIMTTKYSKYVQISSQSISFQFDF